jgi:hypothetical protein
MVRVLLSAYTGPLYQVRKGGDKLGTGGTVQNIGFVAGGFANSAAQDTFCATDSGSDGGTVTCTVSILYDQSGKGNDLTVAPAGCYNDGSANTPDYESSAIKKKLTVGGHSVYALDMNAHEGYRNNITSGMPTGNSDQGIYELADGTHAGGACCWDFGNAATDNCYGIYDGGGGGIGSLDAIFFGTGYWGKGTGNGPWFMGDFEGGVWACGSVSPPSTTCSYNPSLAVPYAFGILKTSTAYDDAPGPQYAIRVGNAQSGDLTTAYAGPAPATWQLKGGIILGIGGDNSNHSFGTFFEGAITAGRPSDDTDNAVFANVQAAGYGK